MSYVELLKDPRWQKKRLQVFDRAGWKCQCCGEEKQTLHVHHLDYNGKEPWETDFKYLESLCEDCHDRREWWNDAMGGRSTISTFFCMAFYSQLCQPIFASKPVKKPLWVAALLKWLNKWAAE